MPARIPLLLAAFLGLATAAPAFAADMPRKHSLAEYAYLVGTWKCTATTPGRKPFTYATSMRWMYPNRTAIDQSITMPSGKADFILTYDKGSDSFKGIFVLDDGSVGVWENPGPVAGSWTEYGYGFKGDDLVPATRATFNGATPRHYAFRFWSIRNKQDAGKFLESDDCNKMS